MKFNVDSYHFKLLRDYERLAVFKEAIDEFAIYNLDKDLDCSNSNGDINSDDDKKLDCSLAYDLGCGSGVLSYLASDYFDKIISIEQNRSIFKCAKENLKSFDNIEAINQNVLDFDFENYPKADLIICEMLDTALIDEEEVPILNHSKKYLKENGKIIPQGIINSAEPVFMNIDYLQYEDDEYQPIYEILGKSVIFSEFEFLDDIDEDFSCIIEFEIDDKYSDKKTDASFEVDDRCSDKTDYFNKSNDKIKVNGIKLTSFTKLNENIICGPTPMLNPAMLVPFEEIEVNNGDKIRIRLSYVMGGGVETIKTEVSDV